MLKFAFNPHSFIKIYRSGVSIGTRMNVKHGTNWEALCWLRTKISLFIWALVAMLHYKSDNKHLPFHTIIETDDASLEFWASYFHYQLLFVLCFCLFTLSLVLFWCWASFLLSCRFLFYFYFHICLIFFIVVATVWFWHIVICIIIKVLS